MKTISNQKSKYRRDTKNSPWKTFIPGLFKSKGKNCAEEWKQEGITKRLKKSIGKCDKSHMGPILKPT